MKNILIVFFIISTHTLSFSQETGSLKNKLDSLNSDLISIQLQLDSLNQLKGIIQKEITNTNIKLESEKLGNNPETRIEVIASLGAKIRSEPSGNGAVLKDLSIGEKFYVTNFFENNFLGAYSNGIKGYVSKNAIEKNEEVESLIRYYNSESQKMNEVRIREIEKTDPNLARLIRRFGEENAKKIIKKNYWIGMTRDMAKESLGNPIDINSSSGSWGTHEQWVYRNGLYLYFENGILTSYQR